MIGLLFAPLHGAANPAADQNIVQRFIDSDFGIVFAAAAHTFGALLFTAGLAVYLYQARVVAHARAEGTEPTLKWLPLAHVLNVLGIGLNGMGGLMRLKESDHPGLELLGSSLWVQVILIKHLFLVVGVGLALYLTARTYQLAHREDAPQNFLPETKRITSFAIVSFSTILLASIFGGIASNAPIPGMNEGGADGTNGGNGMVMGERVYYQNSSSSITATPGSTGRASTGVTIEHGATELHVIVTWQTANALDASLQDCNGNAVSANKAANPTRIDLRVTDPCAGAWTIVITTTQPQGSLTGEPYSTVAEVTVGSSSATMADH